MIVFKIIFVFWLAGLVLGYFLFVLFSFLLWFVGCLLGSFAFTPGNAGGLSKCQPLHQSGLLPYLPYTSIFILLTLPLQLPSGLGLFLCFLWITDPLYHGLPFQ